MANQIFDKEKHVYRNDEFRALIQHAVNFFDTTPVHKLPPSASFRGTGVYALYYRGTFESYSAYKSLNSSGHIVPIYVGKAVPKGWRQSRTSDKLDSSTSELYTRLRQHAGSINDAQNLNIDDFSSRFMIFEEMATDMISTVEAALIKRHRPLWNVSLDGFGNHDPGKGRYEQARSDWDVLHEGRSWAKKCNGIYTPLENIIQSIDTHISNLAK